MLIQSHGDVEIRPSGPGLHDLTELVSDWLDSQRIGSGLLTLFCTHNDEGPDDMPAHIRAALTQTQLSIPVRDGRMALGTWQGIFLFEHRREPPRRHVALHLIGE